LGKKSERMRTEGSHPSWVPHHSQNKGVAAVKARCSPKKQTSIMEKKNRSLFVVLINAQTGSGLTNCGFACGRARSARRGLGPQRIARGAATRDAIVYVSAAGTDGEQANARSKVAFARSALRIRGAAGLRAQIGGRAHSGGAVGTGRASEAISHQARPGAERSTGGAACNARARVANARGALRSRGARGAVGKQRGRGGCAAEITCKASLASARSGSTACEATVCASVEASQTGGAVPCVGART